VELMVGVAMLAVLGALAGPPLGAMLARQRVQSAAQMLSADLAETRHESTRRGGTVYVNFQGGADWCYAITPDPVATCADADDRVLKRVSARQHPGVSLSSPRQVAFDGATGLGSLRPLVVQLASARGDVAEVRVALLGRARACSADGALKGLPRC
jgi:Tfp pilus assembly protein FimT